VEFLDTDAGQILAGAHKYLSAAKILADSDVWKERKGLLLTPVLNSIAHGTELLLKYPLLASGMSVDDVRKVYGHDIMALWASKENEVLRELVTESAKAAWAAASASGIYPDDFNRDPEAEFLRALETLASLHSRTTEFALRYIAAKNTAAPTPRSLIDTLSPVAEAGLKAPSTLLP
jgi:hypothetical protein